MDNSSPLADLLRPKNIQDVVGQGHLLGEGKPLRRMIDSGKIFSIILWGSPGCGKTTIANLLAHAIKAEFVSISAIFSGISDLKKIFEEAKKHQKTVLFVDEIHRFNKTQQDSFLPVLEDGRVCLIGATTENPSFELNKALLSRCQVFSLKSLEREDLDILFEKAHSFLGRKCFFTDDSKEHLKDMCGGDGRAYLNMLELLLPLDHEITPEIIENVIQRRAPIYDKKGDQHYDFISVLHKSMRASDVDAALYWLERMMYAGEDPLYILRRLIRFATEDIGMSDPGALRMVLDAHHAYEILGSPEGDLVLYQAVIYLATAPKSNSVYLAQKNLSPFKKDYSNPPAYALNSSKGYLYDHDLQDAFSGMSYFPEGMQRIKVYNPVERGFERDIKKRLEYWDRKR